ncbi:MAG: hypothetical protein L0206_01140 [Actinobacteria bacterium]|nr:hypothetical protein [Actinomycetota bacterium]
MSVTFRHTETGREFVALEPDEQPNRRVALARALAKLDASPVWERVDTGAASAAPDGQETPETPPTTENPSEAPAAAQAATEGPPSAKDVRAWARVEGLDAPARGPLPDELVEQYVAAHAEKG